MQDIKNYIKYRLRILSNTSIYLSLYIQIILQMFLSPSLNFNLFDFSVSRVALMSNSTFKIVLRVVLMVANVVMLRHW